jgi:hypothetical protein
MALVRTIIAALIAISVALSPAIGEAGMSSSSPVEVMTADQSDMSCCPCCKTQDHSQSTACALKCITLAGAILPAMNIAQPYLVDGLPVSFVDDTSHGVVRKPPTRPPPV